MPKKRWLLGLCAFLLVLGVAKATAQGSRLITVVDAPVNFNTFDVQAAAQPLSKRGATIAVFLVDAGGQEDFDSRLQRFNLATAESIRGDVLAIYVAIDPFYSEIRYGGAWSALDAHSEEIRAAKLDANLQEGVYTLAVVRTLEAIEVALPEAARIAPMPTATFNPPVIFNPDGSSALPRSSKSKPPFEVCLSLVGIVFAMLRIYGKITKHD